MKYLFILLVFCLVGCDSEKQREEQWTWAQNNCIKLCDSMNRDVSAVYFSGDCHCGGHRNTCK